MLIRIIVGKLDGHDWGQLIDNLIEVFIIFGSMIKLLQYIRFKVEFAYFVQMFFAVMKDLGPFIIMFSGFIFIFSLFQFVFSSQAEEADDTYPGINSFLIMLIQTLRVSVGDLKNIEYQKWADNPLADKKDLKFSSSAQ